MCVMVLQPVRLVTTASVPSSQALEKLSHEHAPSLLQNGGLLAVSHSLKSGHAATPGQAAAAA